MRGSSGSEFRLSGRGLLWGAPTIFVLAGGLVLQGGHPDPSMLLPPAMAAVALLLSLRLARLAEISRTSRLALDEELARTQRLASLGELSAGIAHEINTPLAIIGQEAELMRHVLSVSPREIPAAGELRASVEQIALQAARCSEITHRLLILARRSSPLLQEADVNALVEDMLLLVVADAGRRGVEIARRLDPALSSPDGAAIPTDPQMLRQIVLNLLGNAVKAVGDGGRIEVSTSLCGETLEIEVSDTGVGIPPENMDKIFEPFFTTREPGQGTGLGLAIAAGLAERLGGAIVVRSALGSGASFTVRLPAGGPEPENPDTIAAGEDDFPTFRTSGTTPGQRGGSVCKP